MIVHPGFGDLQKWILQVKYSLVAKEWVSDSKILKRPVEDDGFVVFIMPDLPVIPSKKYGPVI